MARTITLEEARKFFAAHGNSTVRDNAAVLTNRISDLELRVDELKELNSGLQDNIEERRKPTIDVGGADSRDTEDAPAPGEISADASGVVTRVERNDVEDVDVDRAKDLAKTEEDFVEGLKEFVEGTANDSDESEVDTVLITDEELAADDADGESRNDPDEEDSRPAL